MLEKLGSKTFILSRKISDDVLPRAPRVFLPLNLLKDNLVLIDFSQIQKEHDKPTDEVTSFVRSLVIFSVVLLPHIS